MKAAPAIAFDLRPSRWIGMAVLVLILLAAAAPWLSRLPNTVAATLSAAALLLGAAALWRHAHARFTRVAWRASGWVLAGSEGREHPALLESRAHLGGLLALGFRHGPRARFRLLLAPDNLDADTRRRLLLLLGRAEVVQTR